MTTELSTKYDPSSVESQAYQIWLDEKCFHANPSAKGEPYTIVIPPPNVTGALHLGHAINNTLQDILIRQHRMRGFNTLWIAGIDHAGIATQAVVEKQLKEKENKTRHDVGREGLVERIWAWKEQYGNRILQQLQRMGCSCDWDRTRFTLDEQCARAVRETFFKLFKDGLIYRGKRLVNWDTFLQTSISDDEIYHETVKTNLWHIRYPICDTGVPPVPGVQKLEESHDSRSPTTQHGRDAHVTSAHPTHMTVATTRPETMLGDTAVAVHSEDPRWNWAIGKFVKLPLTGRLIPIIADDILVDPKFGTGVVKVTPAHDPNDYAVWGRHKGQSDEIDIINILTPDGRIVEDARWQKYSGMKRDAARKQVVEDLKAEGVLEKKEEPYETQVGHSDRSKTPIEPYLSDQWFVKMAPLAEPALEVVREGIIKFFPERYGQTYLAWLGEKRDWPISRQLWWGHRIPVWSRTGTANREFADARERAQGSGQALFTNDINLTLKMSAELAYWIADLGCANRIEILSVDDSADVANLIEYVCPPVLSRDKEEQLTRILIEHGFVQDPDVLDTWFSSALWPHSTLGWPEATAELQKYYPTSVLVTGRDIITLWVARMVMTGMYNMGENSRQRAEGSGQNENRSQEPEARSQNLSEAEKGVGSLLKDSRPLYSAASQNSLSPRSSVLSPKQLGIPFHHVAINPTILDGKGERMSKSKGNGVDPVDIIDSYGADALRFTLTKMATETQDARMPVKKDASGRNTSEKFDEGRNFCNKLWNACRFALSNLEEIASGKTDPSSKDGAGACRPGRTEGPNSSLSSTENSELRSEPGRHGPAPSPEISAVARASLADRWILSRFNRAVEEVNAAVETYRFDVYAKTCYDFFWRDFCDWYVEAIKPALKDPARAPQTSAVLASVLDGILRLMHPMIPFITETVWWRLNDVRPARGIPGQIDCPPSKRLVLAQWPAVGGFSADSETLFAMLQEVIVAIRNIRNEHQVNPKQTLSVAIRADGGLSKQILSNREMIELLATCALKDVRPDLQAIANAATASASGCDIFVEGLVNADAEKQRVGKAMEDTKKKIDALNGRLSNEAYIAKAPANLVQQSRDQLAALEAELAKLRAAQGSIS